MRKLSEVAGNFFKQEASSSIVMLFFAVVALIFSNSPYAFLYKNFLATPIAIQVGATLSEPLLSWINDGLMAIFFFLIGLEIKREILAGELNFKSKILLPIFAAIGGMIVPAFIYLFVVRSDPSMLKGWAIPVATDIVFALSVLSFLGRRIPSSLKIFLTALAIFDDIGAIIIIAVFYSHNISLVALGLTSVCLAIAFILNRLNVVKYTPYILVGLILWLFAHASGVHPTVAGIMLAFAIPLRDVQREHYSPLQKLEHYLQPWVAFGILPLFAFANAGVSLAGTTFSLLFNKVGIGIALGLFLGKQVGIFSATWLLVKFGLASLPERVSWSKIYGVALLCGIGFTMSLFIGNLAFAESSSMIPAVRMGIFAGSLLSGFLGYLVLRCCKN